VIVPERLAALRAWLAVRGVDAFVVPSGDPHGSEYVAPHWQTRAWLSGFDGSAGTLVVAPDQAALWTDARYLLRATAALEGSGIELRVAPPPWADDVADWLAAALGGCGSVGFDAAVLADADATALEAALARTGDARTGGARTGGARTGGARAGVVVRALDDPAAELRTDRPDAPAAPLERFDEAAAGASRAEKLARVRARMRDAGVDAHLVSALDDVAWTLNVRGRDVAYQRVALAYLLIDAERAHLCIDGAKVDAALRAELEADGVALHAYADVVDLVGALPAAATLLLDPARCGRRLVDALPRAARLRRGPSIPTELKAIKSEAEQAGLRSAHLRDGAAFATLLHALEDRPTDARWTEVTTAERLEAIRRRDAAYDGPSFSTIVGYRANSAVGHYQPRPEATPLLEDDGILLIDAGGHARDGTTDLTRTVSLGRPSAEERRVYTTVLRSLIRLSTATFPAGTVGMKLDAIAREPLWRQGWECRHGIGHGIGHALNVHEGPQRFSPDNAVGFHPGMTTTCEPGVYFAGRFGVRLENVLLTVDAGGGPFGRFCAFETLTLCPFDRTLIEVDRLDAEERAWVDAYHARVDAALAPALDADVRAWLDRATRPLQWAL